MKTYNFDNVRDEDIGPVLGTFRNNWRARTVTLHVHNSDPLRVVSIGVANGSGDRFICSEERECFKRQLVFNDWTPFN
jgi:hypothetical protein